MVCDDVDHFFLGSPRQIRDWPVHSLFLDLRNFLQRQIGLASVRRSRFLVAFDELAAQPAKHVISDAGGVADIGVLCETARLKSLVSKLLDQTFERHAVLEGDGCKRANCVHQSADGAAFFGHGDEKLARLTVCEEADGDITFVTGDLELVSKRHAGVGHPVAHRLIDQAAQRRHFLFQFENAFLKILVPGGTRDAAVVPAATAPMSFVFRVFSGADCFEPSR